MADQFLFLVSSFAYVHAKYKHSHVYIQSACLKIEDTSISPFLQSQSYIYTYSYFLCIQLCMYVYYSTLQDRTLRNDKSELTDECGEVDTISKHVAMMIPFYYIPLLLLLIVLIVLLIVKLSITIKTIHKKR